MNDLDKDTLFLSALRLSDSEEADPSQLANFHRGPRRIRNLKHGNGSVPRLMGMTAHDGFATRFGGQT